MAARVVIVGAGPAGTIAGEHIARAGYDVLILEKSQRPGKNKVCGGAVRKTCFAGLKLPDEIVEKECSKVVVHFPHEKMEMTTQPGFVLFDREIFDQYLAQKAVHSGVELLTSSLVCDVSRCDDGLTVYYENLVSRERRNVQARIVIFADGTCTLAQRKFQIGLDCRTDDIALGIAYDLDFPDCPMDSLDFFYSEEISPFGYGWIFPKKDSINVGVLCLLSRLRTNLRSCLDRFVSSANLGSKEVINFGCRLMPQSRVEKLHGDSVLVVGDAAGTADPVDGGGIFNAIVSGELAGRVAVDGLEVGDFSADFLGKYEDLWKKTENFRSFQRSYLLQRLALRFDTNIGLFLKQMGFFKD